MTSPTATEPGLPPTPRPVRPGAPSRADRFFSWTSGLGLVRTDGWLGGVAAGVAARLRIDPLIVRGVFVVIGLFGFPILFLYAVAWALLPDVDGRIHLQDAVRGRFSPVLVAIAAAALLGIVPLPGALLIGGPTFAVLMDYRGGWAVVLTLAFLVVLVLIGGLVFVIVRAARRTPGASPAELPTASAAPEAPDTSAAEAESGFAAAADGQGADAVGLSAPASDPAPESSLDDAAPVASEASLDDDTAPVAAAESAVASDAPSSDLDAWRAQHAAWKEQEQAWRREQQDAARIAREQARRERQARAAEFAVEAAERRRIRRATSPRTPFAFVAVALGLAVIVGTVTALGQGGPFAPALGLFVAAAVLAVAMILAGLLRRRSGFLAFATALTLVGGLAATAVPTVLDLHVGSYVISNADGRRFPASAPFVQPWGDLGIHLADTGRDGETHIRKRTGYTYVTIEPGVAVDLDLTTWAGTVYLTGPDGDFAYLPLAADVTSTTAADGRMRYTATIGDPSPTTRERLVIDQESGYVQLYTVTDDTDTDADTDTEGETE